MKKIFDNKTIVKNFDFCITNEARCDYIKELIEKLIPILEKFNDNTKTKSEQYLLEFLQKIVEIQPYFTNYDGISDQEFEIGAMVSDIILKAFHQVYKYQKPSKFYENIEFFIEKSLKLNCHKYGKAILDLAEDYGVAIPDEDQIKIQALTFSYDRVSEAAKRIETLICNTYFNLIEFYFGVFNDVNRYRALGEMYNDRPENTELYKLILDAEPHEDVYSIDTSEDEDIEGVYGDGAIVDEENGPWLKVSEEESKKPLSETSWAQANDEAIRQEEKPKDDFYSKPRDTWTTEEELKFDKQYCEGMVKHLEKKFKEETKNKLPDLRNFPEAINPYHPDELKKQLKDSYPIKPDNNTEIGGLAKELTNQEIVNSVKRLKKIRRKL